MNCVVRIVKHASSVFPKEVTHPLSIERKRIRSRKKKKKRNSELLEREKFVGFLRIHSKDKKLLYPSFLPESA